MAPTILTALARVDDRHALDNLFGEIPNGEQLRASLAPGFSGRSQVYDQETRVARYLLTDGRVLTVTELTIEQAAQIVAEYEAIGEWTDEAFRAAVERALKAEFRAVQ